MESMLSKNGYKIKKKSYFLSLTASQSVAETTRQSDAPVGLVVLPIISLQLVSILMRSDQDKLASAPLLLDEAIDHVNLPPCNEIISAVPFSIYFQALS